MQIGFLGLLGLLFIGLKLSGAIMWSWWYVLLPLYGPLALVLLLAFLVGIGNGVNQTKKDENRRDLH